VEPTWYCVWFRPADGSSKRWNPIVTGMKPILFLCPEEAGHFVSTGLDRVRFEYLVAQFRVTRPDPSSEPSHPADGTE
jgi:hypothetical protein